MGRSYTMQEAEAMRAEAQPDEEEAEEVETEDLPEPESEPESDPQGPTDDSLKAFERENQRHERAVAKIMGDDFALFEACADCGGVGFRPPAPAVTLRIRPDLIECPECDGYGVQATPSKVPGHDVEQCTKCFGNGYVTKTEAAPPAPPVQLAPVQQAEDPRIAQLKAEGYTIVPPYVPSAS